MSELPTFEVEDEVIVIGAEYGEILEVLENDHYKVDVENRGPLRMHASHLQATGREALRHWAQDS